MDAKYAVQACVLSKRWKDLWKSLTTLTLRLRGFRRVANFKKFVSQVLSSRDGSTSLLNLHYWANSIIASKLLGRVIKYSMLHNIHQLTIYINFIPDSVVPLIFSCQSLTFLKLFVHTQLQLPKSLQLPALKTCISTVSVSLQMIMTALSPFRPVTH
ncbi:F-box/FBD/LRR-repeat protein [Spatholobus suberectus]|nr:F-box/FBD/LRR-repeat protein [Spatholobus suberectus]